MSVARTFPTLVKSHVRNAQSEVATQRELESLLSDLIDIVKDADLEVDARSQMHDGADALSGPAQTGRQRLYHPNLETATPKTDHGVFALLDEGCNMSCHGKEWADHAIRAFEKAGSHKPVSELDTTNVKNYKLTTDNLLVPALSHADSSTRRRHRTARYAPRARSGAMRCWATICCSSP